MRRALAALAACLLLAGNAFAAEAQTAPATQPDAAVTPSVPAATKPAGDDELPPPFMRPRVAKPAQAARPDMTFALKPGPKGFHGLTWGMSLDQARAAAKLEPVTEPIRMKDTYMRPDELLKLGLADLRSVAYYFHKDKLSGIGITFEGEANFFLIKDHLIELYGPGRQIGDRYGWTWKECNIDLRLHSGAGELRYTYEP
jgi:hypothetical protein